MRGEKYFPQTAESYGVKYRLFGADYLLTRICAVVTSLLLSSGRI